MFDLDIKGEIAANRDRIARLRTHAQAMARRPTFYDLPPRFYSPIEEQLWQSNDLVIVHTTRTILDGLVGRGEYFLIREFRPAYEPPQQPRLPKDMRYVLKFGSEGVDSRDPKVEMHYSPTSRIGAREILWVYGTPIGQEHPRGGWQRADDLRAELQSRDPLQYVEAGVAIYEITQQSITDLLVVALSNPDLKLRVSALA